MKSNLLPKILKHQKIMKAITISDINAAINMRSKQGSDFNLWLLHISKDSGLKVITIYKRFCNRHKNN